MPSFQGRNIRLLSILDWRSEENKQRFTQLEKTLGIKINIVSLIGGNVVVNEISKLQEHEVQRDCFDQKNR